MNYAEVFNRLNSETATVVFMKKNGETRSMLCTRNMITISHVENLSTNILGGHDKRCNISNNNVAVVDLMIDEPRSFNIDRVLAIEYFGVVDTHEKMDEAIEKFTEFKNKYEKTLKEVKETEDNIDSEDELQSLFKM